MRDSFTVQIPSSMRKKRRRKWKKHVFAFVTFMILWTLGVSDLHQFYTFTMLHWPQGHAVILCLTINLAGLFGVICTLYRWIISRWLEI